MAIDTISRALSGQASTAAKQAKETADSAMEQAIAAVPGAVSDWLEDNVTPTTPVVDASLSIAGAAADAKATGDGIADLKNALSNWGGDYEKSQLSTGYFYKLVSGKFVLTENSSSVYLPKIDVSDYKGGYVKVVVSSHVTGSSRFFGFGDSDGNSSSSWQEMNAPYETIGDTQVLKLPITDDYFFFSFSSSIQTIKISIFSYLSYTKEETDEMFSVRDDEISLLEKVTGVNPDNTVQVIPSISPTYSGYTRIYSGYIDASPLLDEFITTFSSDEYQYALFDQNGESIGSGWRTTSETIKPTRVVEKYRVGLKKNDNSAFTSADISTINQKFESGEWELKYSIKTGSDGVSESICYVSANGSDSNNGLSRSLPFATIQKAINSGFKKILVREGTYTSGFNMSALRGVSIELDRNYNSFVAETNDLNPKVIIDGQNTISTAVAIANCYDCKFDSIEVKNCTYKAFQITTSSGLEFNDCVAHDIAIGQTRGGGFVITHTNADFVNCGVWNIGIATASTSATYHIDGFNIHGTGTTNFINCFGYNCLDDAVSHHDACYGFIDGGEWYGCGKGGIASPTHGAHIDIRNAYCHDNGYGIYAYNTSEVVTERLPINISNCVCKNNRDKDIGIGSYYTANVWNCLYDTSEGFTPIT